MNKEKLKFSLGDGRVIPSEESEFDESIVVVTIISIVAIAAALFYLKGYVCL